MASSTRGGKRGSKYKKQQIKLKPTPSGASMYQSPSARKRLKEADGNDKLGALISEGYTKQRRSGKYGPEEAGTRNAETTIDRIHDVFFDSPDFSKSRRKAKGGAVRGYEGGGEVCRGNGRAYQGKPKKVQVR